MKKIILILVCLISLRAAAQITSSGTVILTSVNPYYVCMGDSITISFKFKYSGVPTTAPQWLFKYNNNGQFTAIKTFTYSEFYHMAKNFVSPDTIYSFKAKVPTTLPQIMLAVDVNVSGEYPGKNIVIQKCINGIEQYQLDSIAPIYYDLMGNKIDKRMNEVIIEQVGNYRRKVLIQE